MFVVWWYSAFSRRFFDFFKKFTLYLEDRLAIVLTLRLFFTPLFNDRSRVGRVFGVVFRGLWLVGAIVNFVFFESLLVLLFAVLLLMLPLLVVLALSGVSAGGIFWAAGLVVWLAFMFLLYRLLTRLPEKPLSQWEKKPDIRAVSTPKVGRLIKIKDPARLLAALLLSSQVQDLLIRSGLTAKVVSSEHKRYPYFENVLKKCSEIGTLPAVEEILGRSLEFAVKLDAYAVDLRHLFLGFAGRHPLKAVLEERDINLDDLVEAARWQQRRAKWIKPVLIWDPRFKLKLGGGVNRSWTGRITPVLNLYGIDLTGEAQKGRLDRVIGKTTPLEEGLRVLSRSGKNSLIFVGEPGCGKTTLVSGIAQRIVDGDAPISIRDKRLVKLDPGAVEGGTKSKGELEGRLQEIVKEIEASGGIILFIDEIHNLSPEAFAVLEPQLSEGKFPLISTTSWENYRRFIETHEAFARTLRVVEVPEASLEETMELLQFLTLRLERRHKVTVTYPALKGAIGLAQKFIQERVLPDKAIDLLDEAVVAVGRGGPGGIVTFDDIAKIVTERTHVPVRAAGGEEAAELLKLEEKMHQRLVNQEEAVSAVANAVRRARAGLREERRPIVSLLFIGPTGVGKTETTKALAESFFGSDERMVRLDMSEYQEQESLGRLINNLCEPVRRRPYSLVLLDEFEKAHRDVINLFLQVLEEARLTDLAGRAVAFENAIIIATSNAGTDLIQRGLREGREMAQLGEEVFAALQEHFRPELLNRFDGIVLFKPLSREDMVKIARLKMDRLTERLAKKDIGLEVTAEFVKGLANKGYDPALGARPLRRLIQDRVESVLAQKILSGEVKKDGKVVVDESWLG